MAGILDVDRVLKMRAKKFLEWEAFNSLDPFIEQRLDVLFAQLASLIANVNRNVKKQRTPFTIQDFLLEYGKDPPRKKTVGEMISVGELIARIVNNSKNVDEP